MKSRNLVSLVLWSILMLLVSARPASAYIDPGSGSFMLQMIIAGFLGASFFAKTFWRKVKSYFAGLFSKRNKPEQSAK